MKHSLVALLVVNIALATDVAGSILPGSGVPYSYISPYALTYSYAQPPLVLSHPLGVDFEAALQSSRAIDGTFLEDISADDARESKDIPNNQSNSEPSTALGEVSPSTQSLLPGTVPASLAPASNELKYYHLGAPITYTIPTPLAWPSATQFHQQDGLGQYNYGYVNGHSSKQELKLLDGITRGVYNYIDAEGKLQTVSYVSDGEGFRVAATNLPQPVVPVEIPDSPEVAAAKAAHLQAQSDAVATVNRANAADTVAGWSANANGGNVVSSCNETVEGSAPNEM